MNIVPSEVWEIITWLADQNPLPREIWLIGSRANDRARENSDWDLLVFGCSQYFNELKRLGYPFSVPVDVLVVVGADKFLSPFGDKRGSLSKWSWQLLTDSTARYEGSEWVSNQELSEEYDGNFGDIVIRMERAIRLWPSTDL